MGELVVDALALDGGGASMRGGFHPGVWLALVDVDPDPRADVDSSRGAWNKLGRCADVATVGKDGSGGGAGVLVALEDASNARAAFDKAEADTATRVPFPLEKSGSAAWAWGGGGGGA